MCNIHTVYGAVRTVCMCNAHCVWCGAYGQAVHAVELPEQLSPLVDPAPSPRMLTHSKHTLCVTGGAFVFPLKTCVRKQHIRDGLRRKTILLHHVL